MPTGSQMAAGNAFDVYCYNDGLEQMTWLNDPQTYVGLPKVTDLKFSYTSNLLCVLTKFDVFVYGARLEFYRKLAVNRGNLYLSMFRTFNKNDLSYGLLSLHNFTLLREGKEIKSKRMQMCFDRMTLDTAESIVYMYRQFTNSLYLFDDEGEAILNTRLLYLNSYLVSCHQAWKDTTVLTIYSIKPYITSHAM